MSSRSTEPHFRPADLIHYASALFAAAGCDGDKPEAIAAGLVEADLLGHTTHGLQLAPAYLRELESGSMTPRRAGGRCRSRDRHHLGWSAVTGRLADHESR